MNNNAISTEKGNAAANHKRVLLLDSIRGFAAVNMTIYHALYDLVYIYLVSIPWYTGTIGHIWQQAISSTFILISGAALHYGKNKYKHGLIIFGNAMLLTVMTTIFLPSQRIVFGILHMLGVSSLIFGALKRFLVKIPDIPGAVLFFLLYMLTRGVPSGFLGFGKIQFIPLPKWLYSTDFLFPLGLHGSRFYSADYFALIPWFFLYLAGFYLWGAVKEKIRLKNRNIPILTQAGQNSLLIYMLHQPMTLSILFILNKMQMV